MAENTRSVESQENVKQENMSLQSSEELAKTAKEEIEKAMSQALFGVSQMESNSEENVKTETDARPVQAEEEEILYMEPIQDPYGKAIKYLEQHNILQLFQV